MKTGNKLPLRRSVITITNPALVAVTLIPS